MKRATRLLATLGLLSIPSLLMAQNLQSSSLPSSANIFGPELIAWSQLQKPQPVLQPLPQPRERQRETRAANAEVQQQPAAQTFGGRIVKKRSLYVLQGSNDTVYQLDDQQKASQYDGQPVKLFGTLDQDRRRVHVTNIELMS